MLTIITSRNFKAQNANLYPHQKDGKFGFKNGSQIKKNKYNKKRSYKRVTLTKEQQGVLSALRTVNKAGYKTGEPFVFFWREWKFTAIYKKELSDYDILRVNGAE